MENRMEIRVIRTIEVKHFIILICQFKKEEKKIFFFGIPQEWTQDFIL